MRSTAYSLVALALFLILPSHVLAQPPGITVDTRDQIYIFTRSQSAVQVYQPDGKFRRAGI